MTRRGDIWKEWLDACKGGEKAGCDFEWAKLVTEFVLLGNLAVRTGKPVAFDPETFSVKGNAEATALPGVKYHNGWSLKA